LTDALAKKVQLNREGSKSVRIEEFQFLFSLLLRLFSKDNLPSAKYNPEYMGRSFSYLIFLPIKIINLF
jgi:hypothetical protein